MFSVPTPPRPTSPRFQLAIHAAETHTLEARLDEAAAVTEALARTYFGQAAYLRRCVHENRETGDEQAVFEVHYCFDDPDRDFERLATLHNAFTDAFVETTNPEILYRIVLKPVASDAE